MFHISGRVKRKDQNGLASIVIVGILIVLLTLISLGFAKIMDRSVRNSLNDETATAANYAAQSGINDLATFVRSNPNAVSTQCKALIGTSGARGPFYSSSNLSGEPETGPNAVAAGSRHSEYTCLLLNQRPESLYYQQIPPQESKVIKMTTDTTPGSLDRVLLSWQSTDRNKTATPSGAVTAASDVLPDVATWNSNNYTPMLRLTIYPVPTSGAVTNLQADSKTVFLYPHASGAAGTVQSLAYNSITNGAIYHVGCSTGLDAPGFTGAANMDCDLVINGITDITNLDYFYFRLMPIYNHIDFEIKARDIDDRNVKFRGVQAVLDVTAKVGPASKRLQARVDIGGNSSSGGALTPSPNVGPTEDTIPEYTVRSANSICKRTLYNDNYYDYVVVESSSPSCVWSTSIIETPGPQLGCDGGGGCGYYRINGIDYYTENPASYFGTSFIGMGGSANLTWQSRDATSCVAGGGWGGEKAPGMSWDQATRTGTGSESIGGITTVTNFTLRCSGPGGATPTRTVRAWPPPTASVTGPSTIAAGSGYTVVWSSTNSVRCVKSGDWNGNVGTSGSQPFTHQWDDMSTKTYTITCYDPIDRSLAISTDTYTLRPGGCGNPECGRVDPPNCSVASDVNEDNTGTAIFQYSGSCSSMPSDSARYELYSWTSGGLNNPDVFRNGGPWRTGFRPGEQFCQGIRVYAGGWGLRDDKSDCATPMGPAIIIESYDDASMPASETIIAWDQRPICNYLPPSTRNWAHGLWWCRGGRDPGPDPSNPPSGPGCPSASHSWTICNVSWRASARNTYGDYTGQITCRAGSSYGQFDSGGASGSNGPWRWIGAGSPNSFWLDCSHPYYTHPRVYRN